MADYCSDGLWDEGGATDAEYIGLSPVLAQKIKEWHDLYDRRSCYDPLPISVKQFDERAMALAKEIKKELPDWTVECWSEEVSKNIPV